MVCALYGSGFCVFCVVLVFIDGALMLFFFFGGCFFSFRGSRVVPFESMVWVELESFRDSKVICSGVDVVGVVFAVCFCFAVLLLLVLCTCVWCCVFC